MPRGSRHKSHRQHKHSIKDMTDTDDDGVTTVARHGPELVPELPDVKAEVKKSREESSFTKGNSRLGKQEVESGVGVKRKAESLSQSQTQQGRDQFSLGNDDFTATYLPSKKRRDRVESASDRWNGGKQHGDDDNDDAHSLLAYRGKDSKKSKLDSDSSNVNVVVEEEEKSHKAKSIVSGSSKPVIDVPGPIQATVDSKYRIKNRGNRRKETPVDIGHVQVPCKFTEELPLTKAESDVVKRNISLKPITRRMWDKDAVRKELDEGILNRDVLRISGREKVEQNTKQENSKFILAGAAGVSEGTGKQGFQSDGSQEETLEKQGAEYTGVGHHTSYLIPVN
eukprot:Gb_02964 [translate_table: standard]